MTQARRTLDLAMSETQWQQTVTELATALNWAWYHTHDSRRSPAGFPDLILTRERVVFVELKKQRGRLTYEQHRWRCQLTEAGAEIYIWRPSDYPQIEQILTRRGTP